MVDAANLFKIERVTHAIFKHASNLCPSLVASSFGRCLPNPAPDQNAMETSEVFSKEDLCPLFLELGKLHCLVDDRIYTQQTASTSNVVYNAFYDQILGHNNGLVSSKGILGSWQTGH